jgi:hypothetical protein
VAGGGKGLFGCVASPLIAPMTLSINGAAPTSNALLPGTYGGTTIEFDITHPTKNITISTSDLIVTIYQAYESMIVNLWNCPLIMAMATETHIACTLPAVIGVNLTYTVCCPPSHIDTCKKPFAFSLQLSIGEY